MTHRVKSMDTLRSMAILMVMFGHTILGFGSPPLLAPFQLGGIGVDLFFVLSGWLLGGQLFNESKNGSIDVKRFWVRRWMRTLPAYYFILSLTIFQQIITKDNPDLRWDYFLFIQNYNQPLTIFYVSWSLAVEEHFYLFIAPFVAFLRKLSSQEKLLIFIFLLLMPAFFRAYGLYDEKIETHVRVDGCILGVFLAFIRHEYDNIWRFLEQHSGKFFCISVIFFFLYFAQRWYPLDWIGDPGIFERALMFGAWVVYANSNSSVKRNFYFPGGEYVATRSYSLYLLHPEAIAIANRLNFDMHFALYLALVLLLSFAFSEFLYRSIELPFMNMRSSFRISGKRI